MLPTTSTVFEARQQNTAQQQGSGPPQKISAGSGPPPEAGSREIFTSPHEGAAVTTAGVHVPVLHIVGSLTAP